eukprot:GHUV01000936.1.p1 GENE.GHUV01000936.1~~GHUV01000936.1.p1  ORF type:complete len:147 (-),score=17.84 GHUV01000936.1:106-546(-)
MLLITLLPDCPLHKLRCSPHDAAHAAELLFWSQSGVNSCLGRVAGRRHRWICCLLLWMWCHWVTHGDWCSSYWVWWGVALMWCSYGLSCGGWLMGDWKTLVFVIISPTANYTERMYDSRQVPKTCQQDIDTELQAATELQEHAQRR